MSTEGVPQNKDEIKSEKTVQLMMTRAGDHWYRDGDGNVVEFDDATEAELKRQELEPDSEPAEGFPLFSKRVNTMEIPTEGFAQKQAELRTLIENLVDIPEKDRKRFAQQFERATDEKAVDKVRKNIDRFLEKRATASASERTEIPLDTAAFDNKKLELKDRIEAAYGAKKMSAHDVQTFTDAIDSTRYIQELPGIEEDIARRIADSDVQETPPAAADAAEQPRQESSPEQEIDVEDLIRRLGSKTVEERKKIMNELAKKAREQQQQQPEKTSRARPSHQELHDRLTGANERAQDSSQEHTEQPEQPQQSEQPEAPGSHEGADDTPNQSPSDALRQTAGNGHEGAAEKKKEKNKYKINQRDYLGLNIMSVQTIIHDPVHQQFFGELVQRIAPEAGQIILRYKDGGATPEEMSLIKYAAYEYSKWNRRWEDLTSHLTDTDVEAFMRRNEMLDNIAAHVGGSRGKESLVLMLRFTAMRDQATFQSIEHAVHEMHAVRASYLGRRAEGKIQALANRVGIARDDFENVFDLSTPEAEEETRRHLVELFQRKAGKGRKFMDFLSRGSPTALVGSSEIAADNAIRDAKHALEGSHLLKRTGKKMEHLGATLKHASDDLSKVVGTQEVIDQITLETITNEKMRPGSEAGPISFGDVNKKAAEISPPGLENIITEKIKSDPNWASGGHAYQAAEIQKMKQAGEKNLNAGTGFWSWLLRTIFANKFDKAAKNAQRNAGAVH